jgi:proteic killer suppression protein
MYEGDSKKIDAGLRERVEEILTILDAAKSIKELGAPAYRLHPLKGGLKGYWSMTVSANWRIIFRFDEDGPADVDLVDYH